MMDFHRFFFSFLIDFWECGFVGGWAGQKTSKNIGISKENIGKHSDFQGNIGKHSSFQENIEKHSNF
jgi:hypothetical protein